MSVRRLLSWSVLALALVLAESCLAKLSQSSYVRVSVRGSGPLMVDGAVTALIPPDSMTDLNPGSHRFTIAATDQFLRLDTMIALRPNNPSRPDTIVLLQAKRP
ncbi:MAG: hypothetical protein JWM41_898 [Gemmatimonadetes bacterium]|nr:hypothetical protein [Gemmatimonadota bacterium]